MASLLRSATLLSLILLFAGCNNQGGTALRQLGVSSGCDAALTTCVVNDGQLTVSLRMGPGVKPLQPFPLTLDISGGELEVQSVVVDFQMQGMDMGGNRYRFQPQLESWQGTVTLPVCSISRMDWLANVEFTLGAETLQAVFPFHTEAN